MHEIMGIYACISAFVMIGLEHSIANLFLLPLGKLAGAEVSIADMVFKNILPVTIGNVIAGAVIFGGGYSYLYGKLGGNTKD